FLWFLLSVLSKPAAVVFPVVLILLDYWRYEQSSSKRKHWNWQKIIVPKILFFIVSLIMGILTLYTQSQKAIADIDTFTFLQKFLFVCYGFVMYIIKAAIPFKLSVFYPYPDLKAALPMVFNVMPIATMLIIAAIWYSWRYTKIVVLGMAFFLVNIVLVLQFISVGAAVMADRYTYIPYIGIFIILGYGFDRFIKQAKTKNGVAIAAALYIAILSFLTYERTKIWDNDEIIWTDAIEKYPNSVVALNNRAAYYNDVEQVDKALPDFNRVLQLNSKYFNALVGRSSAYRKVGEFEKALKDAKAALEIDKTDERPYITMGGVYFQQQQYNESLKNIDIALSINPNNTDGILNKGILLSIEGNFKASIPLFTQHTQLRPDDTRAYFYRGISYYNLQQNQVAIKDFNKALQLEPQNAQAYVKRSETYLQMGNKAQALKDAKKAQSLGVNISQEYLQNLQ
ncbi:MAG: tetratricopeptide repeat protein, partial [Chitinophagales bacterium]